MKSTIDFLKISSDYNGYIDEITNDQNNVGIDADFKKIDKNNIIENN